jgi:hypothetical protein
MRALRTIAPLFFGLPLLAQDAGGDAARTRVIASRHEVRVILPLLDLSEWRGPRDTARFWGSSVGVQVEGLRHTKAIQLRVEEERRPVNAASLTQLRRAATAALCEPQGMMVLCLDHFVRMSEAGGRIVLTLRDTAEIADLFALRPKMVQVSGNTLRRMWSDSVPVEYVHPQLPEPTAADFAEFKRVRFEIAKSQRRFMRRIGAAGSRELSVAVGDSLEIDVWESRCAIDSCTGSQMPRRPVRWSVDDTSVAVLRVREAVGVRERMMSHDDFIVQIIGVAPGVTTIRAGNLSSYTDTIPAAEPPPKSVEARVRVLPRR